MKPTRTIFTNGTIEYTNEYSEFHREDGPAWIHPSGSKQYFLNGELYSYEEWLKLIPNVISVKWREYCESK